MAAITDPLASQNPQATPPVPGSTAPAEHNASQDQAFGPNNEYLPQELQAELWSILMAMEQEDDIPRRAELQGIVQRRLFFRGQQYWYWSTAVNGGGMWTPPWITAPGQDANQAPTFQHVTNIFQSYCLKLSSILTQNNVQAQFWPQSAKDPIDVSTAKNASKVAKLIHRNNNMQSKCQDAAYFVWTDPMVATYTRFVSDAAKFGSDSEDIIEAVEVETSPAVSVCPTCVYQDPATSPEEEGFGVCPMCGEMMQQQAAVTSQVPQVTGQQEIPKGQEVIDVIGSLNLRRSMWADRQDQFLYLEWVTDLHKSTAKAEFPHAASDIDGSGGDSSAGDGYEKNARRLLYSGYGRQTGSENTNLGTFRRVWLRARAFESCTNDKNKAALKEIFPEGCYVTFYNDVYCESRNESMDDKWVCKNPMPGEGQAREAVGAILVPIQEQLNDICNLLFEIGMFGVPEGFADGSMLDFEARASQTAAPAQLTPVKIANNKRIGEMIQWSPAVEPSAALMQYREELMGTIAQLLSGISPAVWGGDTGQNDTARGIGIERDQALGVLGRVWRMLQEMWATTDLLGVQCFAKHRTQDVEISVLGDGGEWKPEWIALGDLKGNILAYPEVDQQYPHLQSQIANIFSNMLQAPNEITIALLSNPENLKMACDKTGLTDVKIPGEDQRTKTNNDIENLLQGQPTPTPAPAQPQQPGMPPTGPVLVPSVAPKFFYNFGVAFETCTEWLLSQAASAAETDNPGGYLNVTLYAQACQMLQKQKELQQAIVGQAVQGTGPAADMGGANDVANPADQQQGATAQ